MTRTRVLVVGNGMAGARLAEELRHRDPDGSALEVTVVGEEHHAAYNRILLSNVVAGAITARETRLKPDGWWETRGVTVRSGERVVSVDTTTRTARVCRVAAGGAPRTDAVETLAWDELVLATGSTSFLPQIAGLVPDAESPGELAPGVIAFRTADDCRRIIETVESATSAVVLGGGLLGVEAARGLLMRGVAVTIVHPSGRPMDRQLDDDGGAVFARVLRGTGARLVLGRRVVSYRHGRADAAGTVGVVTSTDDAAARTRALRRAQPTEGAASAAAPGAARAVVLDDGTELACDLLVVTAGIVPRIDLARDLGAVVRRGIVVDDRLATSVPHVHAVGECVEHRGEVYGLVAPGWEQARVLADVISGADPTATYAGSSPMMRLKVHDIDLASMGDITTDVHDPDHEVVSIVDPRRGRYAKLVLRDDRIVGALMLGGADAVGAVTQLFDSGARVPEDRMSLLLGRPLAGGAAGALDHASLVQMPGSAVICRCNSVTKQALVAAWRDGSRSVPAIAESTRATTGCGGCASAVDGICGWLRTIDSAGRSSAPTSSSGSSSADSSGVHQPADDSDPTHGNVADDPAALTEGAA